MDLLKQIYLPMNIIIINNVYDTFQSEHQIFVRNMAEDPVLNLLRQHFMRVNECLKDKKNFDILTKFRFKSTCDKAIDDTDFDTDDEYLNPEFELSHRSPGKSFSAIIKQLPETLVEEIESEEFQAETDFEEYDNERLSITEETSSLYNTTFDDVEQPNENDEQYQRKPSRKSLLERPQTPIFEIYDSEDECEYYDTNPKKMEGSQKFILYPEQLEAGDLNFTTEEVQLSVEKNVERPEILEILPRKEGEDQIRNFPSPEESRLIESFNS